MTSCIVKPTPSSFAEEQNRYSYYWWNALRGYFPNNNLSGDPWKDPWGNSTKFLLSGDPLTKVGWIDGKSSQFGFYEYPGGRRLFMSTGPFSMALGDTQEVVIAVFAGLADEPRKSVNYLKFLARQIISSYPDLAGVAATRKGEGHVPFVQDVLPREYVLRQNFPNPFNPSTQINYSLPVDQEIRLVVYNLLGKEIKVLDSGQKSTGDYSATWDGRDGQGSSMPSGVYFCRLQLHHNQITRKLLLIR